MSTWEIFNQTTMGTGLDPVTFPGMGPLREICLGNDKNSKFSHIKQFQIFFSVSQPLIFLKCLRLSGRYVIRLQRERC